MSKNKFLSALLLCVLGALPMPSAAERADRNQAVALDADTATMDDASKTSVFAGKVVLTRGTLVIHADKLTVKQDANGFQYAVATGLPGQPATFRQKRDGLEEYVEGKAERLEYDGKADQVQFVHQAQLKRGRDEVQGDLIVYDITTEFFRVSGGKPVAGAGASASPNKPGRVRAVIQPKNPEPAK